MASQITASMDGTLLNWLKNVGESVNKGDVIAEVEADKATVEIEAPESGVLSAVSVQPGDEIKTGQVIGSIGEGGAAAAPAPAKEEKAPEAQRRHAAPAKQPVVVAATPVRTSRYNRCVPMVRLRRPARPRTDGLKPRRLPVRWPRNAGSIWHRYRATAPADGSSKGRCGRFYTRRTSEAAPASAPVPHQPEAV